MICQTNFSRTLFAAVLCAVLIISGVSGVLASGTSGTLKWKFMTGGPIVLSSPAMDANGTIYVGSTDHYLYAINPDGTLKWRFDTQSQVVAAPTIGPAGTIYVGSESQKLFALNASGGELWHFDAGSLIHSSAAIGEDGTIYFGCNSGDLYALNPNGTEKWHYSTGATNYFESAPAVGENNRIYFGSANGRLYALNADGTLAWQFQTGKIVRSSPSIGHDGTIYFGSGDGNVYALGTDGTEKWRFATGANANSTPALGADGTVYFGSQDFYFYALNPEGTIKWHMLTGSYVTSSPALGADGNIYFGSDDGNLYAVNMEGVEQWRYATEGQIWTSPLIAPDGTIYFGSADGALYALNSDAGDLAVTCWPMFQRDPKHSGRYEKVVVTGDLNGNYGVDMTDCILGLQILAGMGTSVPIDSDSLAQIDVNQNAKVDLAEVLYALRVQTNASNDTDDDGDGYTENQGDCNDLDVDIHPAAFDICGDGVDQDCSGEDAVCPADNSWFYGFYDVTMTVGGCSAEAVQVTVGGDVNRKSEDGYLYIPLANNYHSWTYTQEGCPTTRTITIDGNVVRDLTKGASGTSCGYVWRDEIVSTFSTSDGTFSISGSVLEENPQGSQYPCQGTVTGSGVPATDPNDTDDDGDGYTENQGDCNDLDVDIHPAAFDICGDGVDQDCSGEDAVCPADNSWLYGLYDVTMAVGGCSAEAVQVTVGGDVNRKSEDGYLYIPPANNYHSWTYTEEGCPTTRTITIDGNVVRDLTKGASGTSCGYVWRDEIVSTFSTSDGTFSISGSVLEENPQGSQYPCQGTVTGSGVPAVVGSIVGSWGAGYMEGQYISLTFYPNGCYIVYHEGVEYGTYTYNPETGQIDIQVVLDANGSNGMANHGVPYQDTLLVDGNTLNVFEGSTLDASFERVRSGTSPIVGGWGSGCIDDQYISVTFYPNGYYIIYDGGVEYGTYTHDSATGQVTVNVIHDGNGSNGMADNGTAYQLTIFVDSDTLDIFENGVPAISFERVLGDAPPIPAGPNSFTLSVGAAFDFSTGTADPGGTAGDFRFTTDTIETLVAPCGVSYDVSGTYTDFENQFANPTFLPTAEGWHPKAGSDGKGGHTMLYIKGAEGHYALIFLTATTADTLEFSYVYPYGSHAWSDTTPPAPPTGLAVTPAGTGQLQATWQRSSSQDTAGYLVAIGAGLKNAGNVESYTATGLTTGQNYWIRVTTYDQEGNRSTEEGPVQMVAP